VRLVSFSKRFQLYDARFVSDSPGDNLFGVITVIRFDDRPAAMGAIVTAPLKVVEIACGVDLLDDGITVSRIVRRFDKIAVHVTSLIE